MEELQEGSNFSNPFRAVNWPKAHCGSRVGSCFAYGSFDHFRNQYPVLHTQFQLANLGKVRDGLECWCTRRGDREVNFVEDDFDFFEYEQGSSSAIVVAGRLKSHIQFSRSIGASQFILDII